MITELNLLEFRVVKITYRTNKINDGYETFEFSHPDAFAYLDECSERGDEPDMELAVDQWEEYIDAMCVFTIYIN